MKRIKNCITIVMICILLIPTYRPLSASQIGDGTASDWALSELQDAIDYGLTYDDILNHFTSYITREEFSIIAVKLYEKLSGELATYTTNPFTDTSNPEILKAHTLGIVNGVGNGLFKPNNQITRQELCTMLLRTLESTFPEMDTDAEPLSGFSDSASIADWAYNSVAFCSHNNIINGISSSKMAPLGNTTREQAIILIKRTYESFKDEDSILVPDYTNTPTFQLIEDNTASLSEQDNYLQMDWSNRLSTPKYNTKLNLYIADGDTKPATSVGNRLNLFLIQSNTSTYTDEPYTLIDSDGNNIRYFSYTLDNVTPSKVIWQVSRAPFNGTSNNWSSPQGLVASGEVNAMASEFTIDFSTFNDSKDFIPLFNLSSTSVLDYIDLTPTLTKAPEPITMSQIIYYVRAFCLDSKNNPLVDPGAGMAVIYGKPTTSTHVNDIITSDFELWHTRRSGEPSTNGEFPNDYVHEPDLSLGINTVDGTYYFSPVDFSTYVNTLTIQVSTEPFENTTTDWMDPKGLVYSKSYDANALPVVNNIADSIGINFNTFSPSDLKDNRILYYVRFVAVEETTNQKGAITPHFSDVKIISYGVAGTVNFFEQVTQTVPAYAPTIDFHRYVPVSWEDPEWAHYFEVFRAPKWNEVNFKLKKSNGDILYPYGYYMAKGITPSEYENEIVPQFLVEGSTFKVVIKPKDESWWGDLWSGIVDFFSDLTSLVMDVVNWASSTYASLKSDIINAVASNFILIPSGWRDELATALTMLADYGLASVGIPPTLPNFDALMEGGIDYAVEVALEESGIPSEIVTQEVRDALEQEIIDSAKSAASQTGPNPFDCAFIKPANDYLYSPAHIDFTLYNPHAVASPTGTLTIRVEDSEWPYHPVYDFISLPVPSLEPYETLDMRIYLKEYIDKPYPGGDYFTYSDFGDLYWDSSCDFTIAIQFNLENPKLRAIELGLDEGHENKIVDYVYDNPAIGYHFTNTPKNAAY